MPRAPRDRPGDGPRGVRKVLPELVPETWSSRSVREHARGIELACRAAMEILAGSPDREARLRRVDPVPESTRRLLRRLAAKG